MNTLVIPTARPQLLLEFLRRWRPWPWDAVIVIGDAPELTLDLAAAEGLCRWTSDRRIQLDRDRTRPERALDHLEA